MVSKMPGGPELQGGLDWSADAGVRRCYQGNATSLQHTYVCSVGAVFPLFVVLASHERYNAYECVTSFFNIANGYRASMYDLSI